MFLPNLLKFFLLIYCWYYFSILSHELGHWAVGKLVGMNPYLVKVGIGYNILKMKWRRTIFDLRLFPYDGITYCSYPNLVTKANRNKLLLFRMSGICTNCLLLIAVIISCVLFAKDVFSLITYITMIVIELSLVIVNLLPIDCQIDGNIVPNDGKSILLLFTQDDEQVINKIFEEYKQSLSRYAKDKDQLPQTFLDKDLGTIQKLNDAQANLNSHNFKKAIVLFLSIRKDGKISEVETVSILDFLCSIVINHGQKQYLANAAYWSLEAMQIAGYSPTVKGTRGSILIELGKYEEGKNLLLPLTQPHNELIDRVISCCYLAKAEYFLSNHNQARYWLGLAKELGLDKELGLANNILQRIEQELKFSSS